jgi:hypothetical protein
MFFEVARHAERDSSQSNALSSLIRIERMFRRREADRSLEFRISSDLDSDRIFLRTVRIWIRRIAINSIPGLPGYVGDEKGEIR